MCELLIRTVDKAPLDTPEAYARMPQRGDVIAIRDDGWNWSDMERAKPFWTIIKIPGAPVDAMAAFLAREPGDSFLNKYLRRRQFKFDLDGYARMSQAEKTSFSQTQALALKVSKGPVSDPTVIG